MPCCPRTDDPAGSPRSPHPQAGGATTREPLWIIIHNGCRWLGCPVQAVASARSPRQLASNARSCEDARRRSCVRPRTRSGSSYPPTTPRRGSPGGAPGHVRLRANIDVLARSAQARGSCARRPGAARLDAAR